MRNLVLALYKDGNVVNLNKSGVITDSEVVIFIRGEYDGKPKENESWSYSFFDNSFKNIENNSFEWLDFTCVVDGQDIWSFPLEDWSGNHHQWRRIKTSISDGKTTISINLRHVYHQGEAFRMLSKILTIAKEQGLVAARETFRELSRQEPGA